MSWHGVGNTPSAQFFATPQGRFGLLCGPEFGTPGSDDDTPGVFRENGSMIFRVKPDPFLSLRPGKNHG